VVGAGNDAASISGRARLPPSRFSDLNFLVMQRIQALPLQDEVARKPKRVPKARLGGSLALPTGAGEFLRELQTREIAS
jgi:hypothetical protein